MSGQVEVDSGNSQAFRDSWYRNGIIGCLVAAMVAAVALGIWVGFFHGPPIAFWFAFVVIAAPLVVLSCLSIAAAPDLQHPKEDREDHPSR